MKIAIIGSRSLNKPEHYLLMKEKCDNIISNREVEIYSGGAEGIDDFAYHYAVRRGYRFVCIPAKWDDIENRPEAQLGVRSDGKTKYWKLAGVVRNTKILDEVEAVIAFHDGKSTGTQDMIDKARKNKLKLRLININ